MNKEKQQHTLYGRLLRPVSIGARAAILANGLIYWTSKVVDISYEDDDFIQFETENSCYSLSVAPFPPAVTSPRFERLAACA